MVNVKEIIKEFGFEIGKNYCGYILQNINASHNAIVKYKEYIYYVEVFYKIQQPLMTTKEFFDEHVFKDKMVWTEYGNFYNCHLEKFNYSEEEGGILKVVIEGHSNLGTIDS